MKRQQFRPTFFHSVFLAAILFIQCADAYEFDVHFKITIFLSESAGLGGDAYEIGKYDQAVDDNPNTEPLPDWTSIGYERRRLYHFVDNARLKTLRTHALECVIGDARTRNFRDIGLFLHAFEDIPAHKPYGPVLGHATDGHTPDKPWSKPGDFALMVRQKIASLEDLRSTCYTKDALKTDRSSDILSKVNKWADEEIYAGVGDSGSPKRWNKLLNDLIGKSYSSTYVDYVNYYREWVKKQNKLKWKNP